MSQFTSGSSAEALRKRKRAEKKVKKLVSKIRLFSSPTIHGLADRYRIPPTEMRAMVSRATRKQIAGR